MAEAPYLIGIDYGTGGVRVGIFDREGTPVVFRAVPFETHYPRPGWAEQDPDEWWSCLGMAMQAALRESGVSPEEIAGISLDMTSSTVLALDKQGQHMRPAIMWMDVRAADQARRIEETGDPALKYSGFGAVSAEWGLPKALWLKENEPDTYKGAAHICDCADWLMNRLTGEWAGSVDIASSKYFHDRDQGGFPVGLFRAVGIEDLLEKYPQNLLDLGVVLGGLRKDVAEELGLKPDIPVAQGGVDAHMGALGLGVVEPGKLALITGSSHVMIGQSAKPIHGHGFWGAYTDAMIPGQYTVEAGQASTGSVVAWFKNNFSGQAVAEAERRGVDPYQVLGEMASSVPIGSDGLVVVDYFQG
ncbi:MAG: FGGY family carbohydrate kinase, partial [Candidatus Dormibacteraeota bacterium]|nr:FGGY family carbohydrate kinase [Candidatus Dormibacteraeota bacterium]